MIRRAWIIITGGTESGGRVIQQRIELIVSIIHVFDCGKMCFYVISFDFLLQDFSTYSS